MKLNGKHRRTLERILALPVPSNIEWRALESLLVACGATLSEGRGSRVRFDLSGVTLMAHRPHPQKEAKPYQIRQAVEFLKLVQVIN